MQHVAFYSLVTMCSLFAASTWCLARPHLLSSLAAAVASVLWVLFNGPLEGHVLYVVDAEHGLTASDLLSAVGVSIAAWGTWTTMRRRRRFRRRRRTKESPNHQSGGGRAQPIRMGDDL